MSLDRLTVLLVGVGWLFNPVSFVVSVRGNAESVLGACILGFLVCLTRHRHAAAGAVFGLAVHLKLYPVIYAPAVYCWLVLNAPGESGQANRPTHWRTWLPRRAHWTFGVTAALVFVVATGVCCCAMPGDGACRTLLYQAYGYHFRRVDFKHSFAQHFYPVYLLAGEATHWRRLAGQLAASVSTTGVNGIWPNAWMAANDLCPDWLDAGAGTVAGSPEASMSAENWTRQMAASVETRLGVVEASTSFFNLTAGFAQLLVVFAMGYKLRARISVACLIVTHAFVTFNKVCTSQYFLWSLVLVPAAFVHLRSPETGVFPFAPVVVGFALWYMSQGMWLFTAYLLEYSGNAVMIEGFCGVDGRYLWLTLWAASVLFFVVNIILIFGFIRRFKSMLKQLPAAPASAPSIIHPVNTFAH